MNKIYKIIWSKTQHCFVAVSELCRSKTKILSVSETHIILPSSKKHFSFSKALKLAPIVVGILLVGATTSAYATPINSQINPFTNTVISQQTKSILLQATRQNSLLVDTTLTIPNDTTVSFINSSGDVNIGSNTNVTTSGISASGDIIISGNGSTITSTGAFSNAVVSGNSVSIIGSNNNITVTNGINVTAISGGSITISGTDNVITSSGGIRGNVISGESVNITGSGNTIAVTNGINVTTISGGYITISGDSNSISGTVDGSRSVIISGDSNTVATSGSFDNAISGSSIIISGNRNAITATEFASNAISGSSIIISGNRNTITATESGINAISGDSVSITGISNTISGSVVSSGSVTISGTSNTISGSVVSSGSVTILGGSNTVTESAGNGAIAIIGANINILSSSNTITASAGNNSTAISGDTINILSSSNTITASAGNNSTAISGDTINILSNSNTITVSAGNNATAISGDVITILGGSNTITASGGKTATIINGESVTISGTNNTITASGKVTATIINGGSVSISGSSNAISGSINSSGSIIISGSSNIINGSVDSSGFVSISGSSNTINGNVIGDDITITGIAGGTSGAQIFGNVNGNGRLILNNAWITGTVNGSTEVVNGGFLTASTNTLNSNVTLGKGEHLGFIQVSPTQTSITPHTLTINGNLTGNGGDIWLNTDLGTNANSKVDKLAINGEVAGKTIPIDITNTSQEGGRTTGSGIKIISANSVATTDVTPFRLDTSNGILSVGAYDYHLVSEINSSGSIIWSLVSTISPTLTTLSALDSATSSATSGVSTSGTATSSTSTASNLVVTYSPLAYLVSIPNFVVQNATTENIDAINGVMNQATDNRLQGQAPEHNIWFKLIQAYNNNDTRGTVSTNYKNNLYGFLLGGDVLHLKQDSLGVYTGYQNGSVDAIGTTYSDINGTLLTIPNSNVGNLTLNDYTLGLYNQYHDHNFIVNTFLQGSLGDMETSNIPSIGNDAKFNVNSLAAQATVGYAVTLSKSLELIPFGGVQATWDHLDNAGFKDSTGTITTVDFKHDNTVSVLAGVNGYLTLVKGKNATPVIHLTFGTDIQQYLGGSNANNIEITTNGSTSSLSSSISKTFMNVNVGVSCQATKRLYLGLGVALGYNLGSVHAINFSSTERFYLQYQF